MKSSAPKPDWASKKASEAFGEVVCHLDLTGLSVNECEKCISSIEKRVRTEHQRAVRVVKREIERVRKDQHSYRGHEKTIALAVLENILAALQKGRT